MHPFDSSIPDARLESVGQKAAQIAVPLAILAGVALNFHLVHLAPGLDLFAKMTAIAAGSVSALIGAALAHQRTALWATNAAMVLMVAGSIALMFVGQGQLGILVLLCTTVSWSLAIPMVNWCLGPPANEIPTGVNPASFRLSDPTNPYKNPIPQALVAGAILFSIPSGSGGSWIAGLVFLGAVLALTSLGSMAERTRGVAGDTTVDERFFVRWGPVCALLVAIAVLLSLLLSGAAAALVGGSAPQMGARFGQMFGIDPMGGRGPMVSLPGSSPNPSGNSGTYQQPGQGPQSAPQPQPGQEQAVRPQPASPPPPPPPDFSAMAPQLLAMIVVAIVLAWILKQYGGAILAFFQRIGAAILAPFRSWKAKQAAARRALRLARLVREERERLGDPYPYAPTGDAKEDAVRLYQAWTAQCGAAGAVWRETDHPGQSARRAATILGVPVAQVQPIGDYAYVATYGPPERALHMKEAAEKAFRTFEASLAAKFGETWEHRKEAFADQIAETRAKARLESEL